MKKLVLGAVLFLLACSSEGVDVAPVMSEVVSFGINSQSETKGAALSQTTLQEDGFGVIAFSSADEWEDAKAVTTPNFLYNQHVVYFDELWVYSPLAYWNSFENHSFFAYSPYQSDAMVLSANDYVGTPTITYNVSSDPKDMVDMVTDQFVDKNTDDSSLQYSFKHQLTRLNLTADVNISEGADAYIVMKNLHITSSSDMYTEGVYTFPDDDTEYGEWQLDSQNKITENYSLSSIMEYTDEQSIAISGETNLFETGEYLFLLPLNGTDGLGANDTFEIGFDYSIMLYDALLDDYAVYVSKSSSVSMPQGSLVQGESYIYNIIFNVTSVEFSGKADEWANPTYGNIEYDDEVEVELGETKQIEVSYTDDYNGEQIALWGSADNSKVTVNSEGYITGEALTGDDTVTIKGYDEDGNLLIEIEVTVSAKSYAHISSVALSSSTMSCTEALSSSAQSVTVGYEDSSNDKETYTLTWTSSDTSVATISTSGALTTVADGTTIITVTAVGSVSGNTYTDTMTVTVSAYDTSIDYSKISAGMYVSSSGVVSSSSSGAVAVVYYVGSDYALAVYKSASYRVYQWCPSSYTSTSVSATSVTDGWSNTQAMIAKFGSTSSNTNPAAWANARGTISALYDGKGKGQYYLPSRNELFVLLANCRGKSYSVESSSSYPTSIQDSATGSVYTKISSLLSSANAFVSSTQGGSSYCRLMYSDLSGWSSDRYKSNLSSSSSSTSWASSYNYNTKYYVLAIIKI